MKNGYMYIQRVWQADDVVNLTMELPIRKIYANTAVREDAGQVSIMRGQLFMHLKAWIMENSYRHFAFAKMAIFK